MTAPISPGSSGSGLFNRSGKIIGVVAATVGLSESQNLNFAIPINSVKDMLQKKEKGIPVGSREHFYSEGILAQNQKEYDKAIEYFKKVISIDEKYVNAYIDLGLVYDEKGLFDEELKLLKKAVFFDPKNSDAFYYLAMAYENKGLYNYAISAYKKVIEGSHGTSVTRARYIQASGFQLGTGRAGSGVYFWLGPYYIELAVG